MQTSVSILDSQVVLRKIATMSRKYVAYYRVSTMKQGINGLGMDAQKQALRHFLETHEGFLVAEFAEVESGRDNDRQSLHEAIQLCRKEKATLLIAKLDRLTRNAAFLLNLRDSGVDFLATDMPHADKFTVGIMALVAEKERDMISERTKVGLAAAKRKGIRLGNPRPTSALQQALEKKAQIADAFSRKMSPIIAEIKKSGMNSLRQIAFCLNARGYLTPQGKNFSAQSVKNVLRRGLQRSQK